MKKAVGTLVIFLVLSSLGASAPGEPAVKHHRRFPWGPIVRGALNFAATAVDVAGSQRCLKAGTCSAGSPSTPTDPRVVWPLEMTITGASTFLDFESWKQGRRWGWISPVLGITEHTVGAATTWSK